MKYLLATLILLTVSTVSGCGNVKTTGEASQATTPVLANFSTHTTVIGTIAVSDKQVGKFVSSLANGDNFTTVTTRGVFITAKKLDVPADTSVIYEKMTDIPTETLLNQWLLAGSSSVVVQSVVSLQ
jgi:hypothetical protein